MKAFDKTMLGRMALNNRIGIPPMCTSMVDSKDGVGNIKHIAHYAMLARGKPGFLIQEATAVNAHGFIGEKGLGIFLPRQREMLKEIVSVVHSYGVKIGIQLNHAGQKNELGNQKYGPMNSKDVIGISEENIQEILVNFEFASKWAKELNYDFIEIHAAHGYLIHQFLSPLTNQRTDVYGQDRTLFLNQVIKSCMKNFDRDITIRISAEEYDSQGLHIEDMKDILSIIEHAGICAISVSSGGLNSSPIHAYPLYQIPYATQVKAMCTLPVMGAGLITKKEEIEHLLEDEACDYVLLGRKLLRDPFFLLQWKESVNELKKEEVGECMYRALHV